MKKIEDHVLYIFGQGKRNPFPLSNRMLKLIEEVSELSEAVNYYEAIYS
jgi:NTP pyrophosphatase (non-canonical NTP hydrolase)